MSTTNALDEISVSWQVDGIDVHASLTRPKGEGPYPALIMVAGSGPTDRNWNTAMLPGTNGSAALLARALADSGYVTLRYDKRASGPQGNENAIKMAGKISMRSHLDELAGGYAAAGKTRGCKPQADLCADEQRRLHPRVELSNPGIRATICRARPDLRPCPPRRRGRARTN